MNDRRPEPEIDEALARLRDETQAQLGVARPPAEAGELVRFSDDLPAVLPPDRRRDLGERAQRLDPWLQGPFLLGGGLVVGGSWRSDQRWKVLEPELPKLRGLRVLDVGCNAGYDCFMFKRLGADYVLGAEPYEFHLQARFLESVYRTGVDFQRVGWQDLSPGSHGRFDIVHCHGVLYHELNPVGLLKRLRDLLLDDGLALIGSMMQAAPEFSEHLRFVPGSYRGDPTWWFVPGRLAMRWMIEAAGFSVEHPFGESEGPRGEFPVVDAYYRARRGAPSR
ncbi:MAG TPA: DUF1698 domain-containing protein [Thermoleophilaceae bacterium]|nr:DUF1698 domain-containing protein [Thermoleophilaceae bacterium]